jgi:hypothetical protein
MSHTSLASMVEFLQRNSEQGIQNWTETREVAQRLRQKVEEDARENSSHSMIKFFDLDVSPA